MNLSVEGWRVFDVLESRFVDGPFGLKAGPQALWLKALPETDCERPKWHDYTYDGRALWYEAMA